MATTYATGEENDPLNQIVAEGIFDTFQVRLATPSQITKEKLGKDTHFYPQNSAIISVKKDAIFPGEEEREAHLKHEDTSLFEGVLGIKYFFHRTYEDFVEATKGSQHRYASKLANVEDWFTRQKLQFEF